jgi:plasmid stability protein
MVIFRMVDLLVRDVPETVVTALEKRAAENGRDAGMEVRVILEENLKPKSEDFWERAEKLREELRGRGLFFDSAEIIRQARDER